MISASLHGRLGKDPEMRRTKNDKPMCVSSMAVNAAGFGAEEEITLWVSLVAFGSVAESLARHGKGDMLGCIGKLSLRPYTDRDGNKREGWSCLVEALHSSRTVRPSGGSKRKAAAKASEPQPAAQADGARDFNDEIPF